MSTNNFQINCKQCGAEQTYSPDDQSIKCSFCGAETDIPRPENTLPEVSDASAIVPLTVDENKLDLAIHEHMISGDFTPDDLLEKSIIIKRKLQYVPAYLYTADYVANWSAQFGNNRTETYTDYETKYEGNREIKVPVTKQRTVTDWHSSSGVDTGSYRVAAYGGDQLEPKVADFIGNGTPRNKTVFNASYLAGFDVEKYGLAESTAFTKSYQYASLKSGKSIESSALQRAHLAIEIGVKRHAKGDVQKDWHWTTKIQNPITETVLLPLAFGAFEYAGKEYSVWVDGNNPARVLGDQLPIDKNRKIQTYLGFVPLGVISGATLLVFYITGDLFWWETFIPLTLAGLYAYFRKKQIISHSKEVRSAQLLQRQANAVNTDSLSDTAKAAYVQSYQTPKPPILGDTSKDKIILPLISIIGAIAVLSATAGYWTTSTPTLPQAQSTTPSQRQQTPPITAPPSSALPQGNKASGWASVYWNDRTSSYSWSVGHPTAEAARTKAQNNCETQQGAGCKEWATIQKKCFAIYSNKSAEWVSLAFGDNIIDTKANADRSCQSKTGSACALDDRIGSNNAAACDSWQ